MVFVSGADSFGPDSGKYTSFQGKIVVRRTVIDYVACSRELFSQVKSFAVADRVPGYDHAALKVQLEVDVGNLNRSLEPHRKRRKVDVDLPDDSYLDKLFIQTLAAGKDEEKKRLKLYGPVLDVNTPLKMTIQGTCLNAGKITATAGSSAYSGSESRFNISGRVWGNQTSPRADLMAAFLAIKKAPRSRSLEISTRSEEMIRSLTYYAARNDACGWRCKNGDIQKRILALIKIRTAPIHFCWIR
ncbi:hypothetical protein DFH06DRAFT_979714, partial [Mycena polygramma]